MTMRAIHLRLLPPPAPNGFGLDHPVFGVAAMGDLLRRLRLAEESGDAATISAARADMRARMAKAREAAARPIDLSPYRASTPAASPTPLLIVIEPDRVVYRALVDAEGLSSHRVRRVSTFSEALPLEADAVRDGRRTMVLSREGAS